MTDILETIRALREMGATQVTLHPDGSVASVVFGPESSESEAPQRETPAPKRKSATGGLVPRDSSDD